MKKFVKILIMFTLILMTGCIPKPLPPEPPPLPISPDEIKIEKIDVDVYLDATVSMKGYTALAAGNVYLTLPDILDDLGSSMGAIKFYRFGAQVQELEGRSYRNFATPTPYVETITAISNVVDAANPEHLSIVVTDLFEDKADWSNVVQKIRGKFFENHLAFGVIGIKNSFNGKIFDVGLNSATFDYNSHDYPHLFRPFYILVMGKEFNVKHFMEEFKERQTLPNDTEYLLLMKNLSVSSNNLNEQEILEITNLFREEKFDVAKKNVREFGIKSFKDPAILVLKFKHEVPLGACPFEWNLKGKVNVSFPENDTWQPLIENEVPVNIFFTDAEKQKTTSSDADFSAEIEPVKDSENDFTLKITFVPDRVLKREDINFMTFSVSPTGKSYKLPSWVTEWNTTNADISPNNFDGSKTINLIRVLGSLKDSLYSTESPNIINVNFILYKR